MRLSFFLTLGLIFAGCGGSEDGDGESPNDNQGGSGGTGAQAGGAGDRGEIGTPAQIAPGQAALLGVTSDGWVVFREGDVLRGAKLGDASTVQDITGRPGSVLIRGRVVFNWADVNWELGIGDLSVWTSDAGAHDVGPTPFAEALVAASDDGSTIVYTANTRELGGVDAAGGATGSDAGGATGSDVGAGGSAGQAPMPDKVTDLVIASSDVGSTSVLIESMGLGSDSTCNPTVGFVGQRLFVGWCTTGSRAAKIERYELAQGMWSPTTIAEDTLSAWSTDRAGESVFYQSSGYSGYVSVDGDPILIDAGVSAGTLLPDGSTLLYSVGDQLRRTALPEVNPVAIITTGYKQPIGFSRDFGLALYSTTVSYEHGTQRDLLLSTTSEFNPDPIVLVSQPVATLARSSMTSDGNYIFWLTDVSASGGSLHVVDKLGGEVMVLPNVVEAAAGDDSVLLFTDNASDPDQYPVVADLKIIDLSREDEPRLVEEKILDGKNFYVDESGTVVSYVRSGVDREAGEPDHDGVFSVSVR
jgi:hypothetical protein